MRTESLKPMTNYEIQQPNYLTGFDRARHDAYACFEV